MNPTFNENIKALSKVDEPVAVAMQKLAALNKPLRYLRGNDDNLFDSVLQQNIYENEPLEFTQKSAYFRQNFPKHPVIFLFGFGNGKLIKFLLENPKHKRVIVFENELDPIFYTLYKYDLADELKNERFILFYVPNLNPAQFGTLFTYKDIDTSLKTYNLTAESAYYEQNFKAQIQSVNERLIEAIRFAFIRKGNDPMDSVFGIEHTMQNLPKMLSHAPFQSLLDTRKKASKNAVVVSTGPSLIKQLPLLKEIQQKVTILCADSAYQILHTHGIKPDYVLSLERFEPTSELFNYSFEKDYDREILFIMAAVTHENTIKYLEREGREYMIAFRPGLFPQFLKLPEFGYIGVNHSVGNMNFELAAYLKHENIALIGQDLAYSDTGKSHPSEYMYAENEEIDPANSAHLPEIVAYGGVGKVKTCAVWELFKQGFENDVVMARVRHGATTYNCTEGGARIEGTIEIPFKEFVAKFVDDSLKKPFKKVEPLSQKEQKELLKKTKNRLKTAIKKSDLYFESVKKELLNLQNLLPRGFEFEKLDFKALKKAKIKLATLYEQFKKSTIFTEVTDVGFFQNNCEMVKIEATPCHSEMDENKALVVWLTTMGNWFIEMSEYVYTQNERILRHLD